MPDLMRDGIEIGNGLDADHTGAGVVLALCARHDAAFATERGKGFHQTSGDVLDANDADRQAIAGRSLIGKRAACHDLIGRKGLRWCLRAALAEQHFPAWRGRQFQTGLVEIDAADTAIGAAREGECIGRRIGGARGVALLATK